MNRINKDRVSSGNAPMAASAPKGNASMYSPATFFDVLESAADDPHEGAGEADEVLPHPVVAAFYGFRGGSGRTLALAHCAAILARNGHSVAAVDLDLEAPGLHIALNAPPGESGRGSASLLRRAAHIDDTEALDAVGHLVAARTDNGGLIRLLPAGPISREYLGDIEELGVALWHASGDPSPFQRIVDSLKRDLEPDFILVDCRPGFSGLSASVMFHTADIVVAFLPLSDQVLDGLRILLEATKSARSRRGSRPALLLVPAMVPPGEAGRVMLAEKLPRFQALYHEILGAPRVDPDLDEADAAPTPWLEPGLRYDAAVATTGHVDESSRLATWAQYMPLADRLAGMAGASKSGLPDEDFDVSAVLRELKIEQRLAFADDIGIDKLVDFFVAPEDLATVIDRATALVVGAKGAGKTWLFRALVNGKAGTFRLPEGMQFVVGHAAAVPEAESIQLSPDSLKEIDKAAKLGKKGTYKAFWHLYAVARLARKMVDGGNVAIAASPQSLRGAVHALTQAEDPRQLQRALVDLLKNDDIGSLSEDLLARVDAHLLKTDRHVTLVYDGLDTGFQSGNESEWLERRNSFTGALLQVVSEQRTRLRRIFYKVFLREDIWLAVSIQNKSHLEAVKAELSWRPSDLWRMTLNLATTSATYTEHLRKVAPGFTEPWEYEEATLQRLLFPFWGETLEKKKTAKTANYVRNRTSDAAGRLFPRTLVQLVHDAVTQERKAAQTGPTYRVVRFTSLRDGISSASKQRVRDLEAEYAELKPYLKHLGGMGATGFPQDFINHLKKGLAKERKQEKRVAKGAEPGMLHAGQGGWVKVVELLRNVGVLGQYRRGPDKDRLEVALLYRAGLGVKHA